MCIVALMTRTNIELDDDLVREAMRRYGSSSKRSIVDLALRRLIDDGMSTDEALAMEGVGWEGDLDAMRESKPTKSDA